MLKNYLPTEIYNLIIKNFNFADITEIRMRVNQKLIITLKSKKFYLKDEEDNFVIVTRGVLDYFIKRASENSIYAFNDNIVKGFITLKNGIRVGICGNVVCEQERVITIKDFQAVNIRIPHFIKNCSLNCFELLVQDRVHNTLIISPPGAGKTTFLKDFIYQLGEHNLPFNILVADERNEICSTNDGEINNILGGFVDTYTNCAKKFAFTNGIRSMSPDVIITDEIDLESDLNCLVQALNCGVNVVATIHAKGINDLKNKPGFEEIINKKLFSRYVVLSNKNGPGSLVGVFDEKLNMIMCG